VGPWFGMEICATWGFEVVGEGGSILGCMFQLLEYSPSLILGAEIVGRISEGSEF